MLMKESVIFSLWNSDTFDVTKALQSKQANNQAKKEIGGEAKDHKIDEKEYWNKEP